MTGTSFRTTIGLLLPLVAGSWVRPPPPRAFAPVPPAEMRPRPQQGQPQWPQMVDRTAIDTTCVPCTDFHTYANGAWLKRATLLPSQQFLSPVQLLGQRSSVVVQFILETDARMLRNGSLDPRSTAGQLGALFTSCMDTVAIANAGFAPLRATLHTIAAIRSAADLARAFAIPVGSRGQRLAPFWVAPAPDPHNSSSIIVNLFGGSAIDPLFLNPKARTDSAVSSYLAQTQRALTSLGVDSSLAARDTRADFSINEALGRAAPSTVEMSDPRRNDNRFTFDRLTQLMPHFGWPDYYRAMGIPQSAPINVESPAYYATLDSLFGTVPLEHWRAQLRIRLLAVTAETRSSNGGADRGRACASLISNRLGRAIAREYAAKELTPAAQLRLDIMVDNIVTVLRDRIQRLDWMSPSTRKEALAKVARLRRHLGAPANPAPYGALQLRQDDFYANLSRIEAYLQKESWASVGKPVDPEAWRILPQVANAGYWPSSNELGVPAAFLHPPYFDPEADDAANYGALGAVIGHELTHAFDNNGRRYDAAGNLRDWWTAKDDAQFNARTKPLIAQFDGYLVVDSATHVRGQQTLDENISDLGGAILAFDAFQRATRNRPRTVIDGFTAEQRFFIALAQTGADLRRPDALRQQVLRDWHAPSKWRVNGVLSNFPEFARAWGCKSGDQMVRDEPLRPRIW